MVLGSKQTFVVEGPIEHQKEKNKYLALEGWHNFVVADVWQEGIVEDEQYCWISN